MVFGFLRRNKKEKKNASTTTTSRSSSGFWEGCLSSSRVAEMDGGKMGNVETKKYINIPFVDICNHIFVEDYLKDVIKNDSDVHRRTSAFVILFQQSRPNDLVGFYSDLASELNLSQESRDELVEDISDFFNAKGDADIQIQPDENLVIDN